MPNILMETFLAYVAMFIEFATQFSSFTEISPYNGIVHGHGDDLAFKLLRFALYFCHHLLNQLNSGNFFHSNSIGSPSIVSIDLRQFDPIL